jgi:hypothetical protein
MMRKGDRLPRLQWKSRTALFLIKLIHSVVFIVESVAILYIVYSGLFNVHSPWLVVAIVLVLAEIIVYVGNGTHCPLTKLARSMGDKTGDDFIADIFLPKWFAPLIPPICGTLAVFGLVAVGLRLLTG